MHSPPQDRDGLIAMSSANQQAFGDSRRVACAPPRCERSNASPRRKLSLVCRALKATMPSKPNAVDSPRARRLERHLEGCPRELSAARRVRDCACDSSARGVPGDYGQILFARQCSGAWTLLVQNLLTPNTPKVLHLGAGNPFSLRYAPSDGYIGPKKFCACP